MKYVIVLKYNVTIDGVDRVAGEVITVDESFDKSLIRRVIRIIDDNNSNSNSN